MVDDRSRPDRYEGLQAVRNTLRQSCLVDRVLGFRGQLRAPFEGEPLIRPEKCPFRDWTRRSAK